jgi:WD40 repeat protein
LSRSFGRPKRTANRSSPEQGPEHRSGPNDAIPWEPPGGWLSALRGLLFGYDYFISYAQEPATRQYGEALQRALAERDYVCFRDTTNLSAGDPLTLKIRWSLRRTRCLIVLGTTGALTSKWVAREIEIFSSTGRTIIPLDLEAIRPESPWSAVDDVLFVNDSLPLPSTEALDKITGAFRGWRANRWARWALVALGLIALGVGSAMTLQAFRLHERALQLRNQALVAISQALPDPLAQGLVLLEADPARMPADVIRLSRAVVQAAVPETVLRASNSGVAVMATSADGKVLVTVDDEHVVRRWNMDGTGGPTVLCRLDWVPARVDLIGGSVLCSAGDRAALIRGGLPGAPLTVSAPEDQLSTAAEPDASGPNRWVVAERTTAWRCSTDGRLLGFCQDRGGVLFYEPTDTGSWKTQRLKLPHCSILDIAIGAVAADGAFGGTLLCTNGEVGTFAADAKGIFSFVRVADLVRDKHTGVSLPEHVRDARALFADGHRIVAGLREGRGLVVAEQAGHWIPRRFEPGRKLKGWVVDPSGTRAAIQWESGDLAHLDLRTLKFIEQPAPTHVQYWSSQDYVLGPKDAVDTDAQIKPLEFERPALSASNDLMVLPALSRAWVWSTSAGRPLATLRPGMFFDTDVRPVFTRDGTHVAIAESNGEVRVWRTDGRDRDPRLFGLDGKAYELGGSRGDSAIVGTTGGSVYLLRKDPEVRLQRLCDGRRRLSRCAASPSGSRGAAMFDNGTVELFDLRTARSLGRIPCQKPKSSDGDYPRVDFVGEDLVVASGGASPQIIGFAAGKVIGVLPTTCYGVKATEAPAERRILVKTDQKALELWDVAQRTRESVYHLPRGEELWGFDLSQDETRVAAGLGNGRVLVWNVSQPGQPVRIDVAGKEETVDCVAFSPDALTLAFGTDGGRVGIVGTASAAKAKWLQAPGREQATGSPRDNLAHLGPVGDLRFDESGRRLISCGSMDGLCNVWDLHGSPIETLYTGGVITFGRFLSDGRVVTLTEHGQLAVWRIGLEEHLKRFRTRTNVTLIASQRMRYLGEDADTAYAHYCSEERRLGRTPLPRSYQNFDYR